MEVKYGGSKLSRKPIRNVSIDNFSSDGITYLAPRRMLSFAMSKSGVSDLITSPHRASGVGAILLSKTLLCSRPPVAHREQCPLGAEKSEPCHPVTGPWPLPLIWAAWKTIASSVGNLGPPKYHRI